MGLFNSMADLLTDEQEDKDTKIGGFNSCDEAMEHMRQQQIDKHRIFISISIGKLIALSEFKEPENKDKFESFIVDRANYFEFNQDELEERYNEKDYHKLIDDYSKEIVKYYEY